MSDTDTRAPVAMRDDADLLRFSTCGSVDDGKSTLIGRLLYDTKSIFEDQLAHVEEASRRRGDDYTDLALLTDGLRAEREQGITIDVAYRYFATPRRKFIIADTPGHIQYTRNMVTGASTANLAIVLINANKGLVEQSRRHAFIASLLRIPHLVFAINKMDLVDWREDVFRDIERDVRAFASNLDTQDISFIPMSALMGDNVVDRSPRMAWYDGPTLLHHLETVHIGSDHNLAEPRFPVQWVIRPQNSQHRDYRGYAGQVAGGVLKVGDEVMALPSGFTSKIKMLDTYDGPVDEAFAPMSVTVHLEDELDISRGDMLVSPDAKPFVGQDLDAMVCWMTDTPLTPRTKLALKHSTRWVRALVSGISHRVDIQTMAREEGVPALGLNDIGRIQLRTTAPLFYDEYRKNRATGSFILVDEATHNTVGAGMLLPPG
jgi:sulfate adenylyltransferase large subunit